MEPVHPRHLHVHTHHVVELPLRRAHGLVTVAGHVHFSYRGWTNVERSLNTRCDFNEGVGHAILLDSSG